MSKIQEIEKRWSEATPGPWKLSEPHWRKAVRGRANRQSIYSPTGAVAVVFKAQWAQHEYHARTIGEAEARGEVLERIALDSPDGPAIANAPSDVAYLLAEVKRLKDGIKHLQNFVCMCHEMHPDQYRCSTCIQADEILKEAAQ